MENNFKVGDKIRIKQSWIDYILQHEDIGSTLPYRLLALNEKPYLTIAYICDNLYVQIEEGTILLIHNIEHYTDDNNRLVKNDLISWATNNNN